jgi:pimeloyl-ACP methyl ester carboxylesterase
MTRTIAVAGISLELEELGSGRPLLFLHPGEGLQPRRPWLELLAQRYRVIAPHHPGWGNSTLPRWLSSVDDLAYLYLDLADALDLSNAALVGVDFGSWIAAEMAVRATPDFRLRGAGRSAGDQGWRRDGPRHCGHACHAAR